MPLIGGQISAQAASGNVEKGDLANLELKGILRDKRGKIALIASSSGEPYTLRSGRIYDKKNRIVNGVSGIIKETSVILVTQNRTIKELTLSKKETAGASAPSPASQ